LFFDFSFSCIWDAVEVLADGHQSLPADDESTLIRSENQEMSLRQFGAETTQVWLLGTAQRAAWSSQRDDPTLNLSNHYTFSVFIWPRLPRF
jgi:hypothetical protein